MSAIHPFEKLLIKNHAFITVRYSEFFQGHARTDQFQFRFSQSKVEVGIRFKFDHWSNSTHVVCQPLPHNKPTFDAFMHVLAQVLKEPAHLENEEPENIWPRVHHYLETGQDLPSTHLTVPLA